MDYPIVQHPIKLIESLVESLIESLIEGYGDNVCMRLVITLLLSLAPLLCTSPVLGQFNNSMLINSGKTPATPSSLTATAISTSQISLNWIDTSDNENGFTVERSANGTSGWSAIGTTPANTATYSDSSLLENSTYFYRIKATSTDGPSTYSATASTTTKLATPTSLSAAVASASQINLSWADNSGAETGYQIERSTDNASWSTVATAAAGATSFSNSSLGACQGYYYRVKAVNASTSSDYAESASATTQPNHGNVDFYSSGTWYVPGCITSLTVYIWGGGGGGGSGPYWPGGGGGGGGGAAAKSFAVSPGQAIGFTVGGGGAGEATGGTTSCAGMNAYGGGGGRPSYSNCGGVGAGGAGGGASGGSSNWGGGNGAAGGYSCSQTSRGSGGAGGASANGGPGNGGSGGCGWCGGAAGGGGMVRIYY